MNDLSSIPTVNLREVVRVVTISGTFDAEVLLTFANGSRNVAYTDAAGNINIIRTKA
jgi:hypothetical protein